MDLFNQLHKTPAVLKVSEQQFGLYFLGIKNERITAKLVKELMQQYSVKSALALPLIRFIKHAISQQLNDTLLFEFSDKQYLLSICKLCCENYILTAHLLDSRLIAHHTNSHAVGLPANRTAINSEHLEERRKALVEDNTALTDSTNISFLAFHDPLTLLPNRALAIQRLEKSVVASEKEQLYYSLIFIDVDDFKNINDSLGHNIGDEVLKTIADRLVSNVRAKDTVARLGGDEFLVILSSLASSLARSTELTNNIVLKLSQAIKANIVVERQTIKSSISQGITLFKGQEHSVKSLMQQADMAMYCAKASLKGSYEFFNEVMRERFLQALQLEKDLNEALVQEQFVLYYQPKFTDQYRLIGAEALVRWQHPTKGLLYPNSFISELESSGLIYDFGYWLITKACETLEQWQSIQSMGHCQLSINVSTKQLNDDNFIDKVTHILGLYQLPKGLLVFEITESLLLENIDKAIAQLNALAKLGLKFSIDDFGTGYSSLLYLKQLPIHEIKIDRSFVQNVVNDKADEMIVKTIVNLANNFELSVVAEGVEEQGQLTKLVELGCHQFQGFLCSEPLPEPDFLKLHKKMSNQGEYLHQLGSDTVKAGLLPLSQLLSQFDYWRKKHSISEISMLMCKIDNVEALSTGIGFSMTELALARVAKRLAKVVPSCSLISQWQRGGFIILLTPEQSCVVNTQDLVSKCLNILKRPMLIHGCVIHINPLVSVADLPNSEDADTITRVLAEPLYSADKRLSKVEQKAGQPLPFALQQKFKSSFVRTLPDLINGELISEFEIIYQPIIRLLDNQVVAVEAKVEWQPNGNKIKYDAEQFDLGEAQVKVLNTLSIWCTELALADLNKQKLDHLTLTIPISLCQLASGTSFVEQLCRTIAESNRAYNTVRVELTELIFEQSPELTNAITKLKSIGVSLGLCTPQLSTLCDHASDYSIYDYVKLKQEAYQLSSSTKAQSSTKLTAQSFSALSQVLGITPMFSGVESAEDIKLARQYGIREVQGSAYCQPILFNRFISFLSQYNNNLYKE